MSNHFKKIWIVSCNVNFIVVLYRISGFISALTFATSKWTQGCLAVIPSQYIHQLKCLLKNSPWCHNRTCIWHNRDCKLFFISVYCCVKLRNLYNCSSKSLKFQGKEFIYRHRFQKLAVMLLVNAEEVFLPKILMIKKHPIKWKQTWMPEIKFNVLNHPI